MAKDAVSPDDPRAVALRRIVWVMDRLRGEGGCPWDREQTHQSLRSYLLEESYELLEALDAADDQATCEELGDVLFQVLFHCRVAQDQGAYDLGDVATGIAEKLVARHPHVFQMGHTPMDAREVEVAWEARKKEQKGRKSILDGVPAALPALLRAQRVQEKAARVGFDWPSVSGPLDKLDEELGELRAEVESGDADRMAEELGDLLFSAVNLARHLKIDAEGALREASARFERRFRRVEELGAGKLKEASLEDLERLWQRAKGEVDVDHP
jgi:MazG family protein